MKIRLLIKLLLIEVTSLLISSILISTVRSQVSVYNSAGQMLGYANGSLQIAGVITTSPTPKITPKPIATPTIKPVASPTPSSLIYLHNIGPRSTVGPVQSDAYCNTIANAASFPETTPYNVNDGFGWNSNNQLWLTPSYFYSHASGQGSPTSAFSMVDGNYSGTTQNILRWAACKWGVDEEWVYAETEEENHNWEQSCAQAHGGNTCRAGGDCNNPDSDSGGEPANLNVTLGGYTFKVTDSNYTFIGTQGIGGPDKYGNTCTGSWASYGAIQNKIAFWEWYAWPMGSISTAWAVDYRFAKFRACMNSASWFTSSADYKNAISAATSNPNGISGGTAKKYFPSETNLQYLALGCIGGHYSGDWYTNEDTYLITFVNILQQKTWPGSRG